MNKLILSFFVGIILFYLLNNIRLFTIGGVSSGCTYKCEYKYSSEGIKNLKCPSEHILTEPEKQTYINAGFNVKEKICPEYCESGSGNTCKDGSNCPPLSSDLCKGTLVQEYGTNTKLKNICVCPSPVIHNCIARMDKNGNYKMGCYECTKDDTNEKNIYSDFNKRQCENTTANRSQCPRGAKNSNCKYKINTWSCLPLKTDKNKKKCKKNIEPKIVNNTDVFGSKAECEQKGCGYACIKKKKKKYKCELNTSDTAGYINRHLCNKHCKVGYMCDKKNKEECWKCKFLTPTQREKVQNSKSNGRIYNKEKACKMNCEDKSYNCDYSGSKTVCKCLPDLPEKLCENDKYNCVPDCKKCENITYAQYKCSKSEGNKCQLQNIDNIDQINSPYAWKIVPNDNFDSINQSILQSNCNNGNKPNKNITKKNLLVDSSIKEYKPCNRPCSDIESHYNESKCKPDGNMCTKSYTIKDEYKPTGVYENVDCTNKEHCKKKEANRDNCNIDLKKCFENPEDYKNECKNCKRTVSFIDGYGRKCKTNNIINTKEVSCISLSTKNFSNKNQKNKCDLQTIKNDIIEKINDQQRQIKDQQKQIKDQRDQIETIRFDLNKIDIPDINEKIEKIEKDIDNTNEFILDTKKKLEEDIDNTNKIILDTKKKMDTQNEKIEDEIKDINTDISDKQKEINNINTHISNKQKEINITNIKLIQLTKRVNDLSNYINQKIFDDIKNNNV